MWFWERQREEQGAGNELPDGLQVMQGHLQALPYDVWTLWDCLQVWHCYVTKLPGGVRRSRVRPELFFSLAEQAGEV